MLNRNHSNQSCGEAVIKINLDAESESQQSIVTLKQFNAFNLNAGTQSSTSIVMLKRKQRNHSTNRKQHKPKHTESCAINMRPISVTHKNTATAKAVPRVVLMPCAPCDPPRFGWKLAAGAMPWVRFWIPRDYPETINKGNQCDGNQNKGT